MGTLRQYMEGADEQAIKLLEHLLEFDPRRRIDAHMALVRHRPGAGRLAEGLRVTHYIPLSCFIRLFSTPARGRSQPSPSVSPPSAHSPLLLPSIPQAHPYLSRYADVSDEPTRPPIDTSFERSDLPVDDWVRHIEAELQSLDVIRDGTEAQAGAAAAAAAAAAQQRPWGRGRQPPPLQAPSDDLGLGDLGTEAGKGRRKGVGVTPTPKARALCSAAAASPLNRLPLVGCVPRLSFWPFLRRRLAVDFPASCLWPFPLPPHSAPVSRWRRRKHANAIYADDANGLD